MNKAILPEIKQTKPPPRTDTGGAAQSGIKSLFGFQIKAVVVAVSR